MKIFLVKDERKRSESKRDVRGVRDTAFDKLTVNEGLCINMFDGRKDKPPPDAY